MKIKVAVSEQEKPEEKLQDYKELCDALKCRTCEFDYSDCIYHPDREIWKGKYHITSKMLCPKFQKRLKIVKTLLQIIFIPLLFLLGFGTLKFLIGTICYGIVVAGLDELTDNLLIKFYENAEVKRKQEYDNAIKKLEKENMTDEEHDFFVFAESLYKNLSKNYKEIMESKALVISSNDGKRVKSKFKEVLTELENLNKKLSIENIGTSYIKTLYKLHLVKLLEISGKFIGLLKSNEVTDEQVIEFSNLLEVFRKKISDNQIYLHEKAKQDFIIKMLALNEDVDSTYSGNRESEENNNA